MTRKEYRTATKLVRGGVEHLANQETAEALYMTSGFVYSSAEEAAAAFRDEADVFVYSRYGNPTLKCLKNVWPCLRVRKRAGRRVAVWRQGLARWPANLRLEAVW